MTKTVKKIANCRLCGSKLPAAVINFGLVPLANNLKTLENLGKNEFKAPLMATTCKKCGSHQLLYEVDPGILFKNYQYATPPNLIPHFKEYAATVSQKMKLKKKDTIVGIGGNSGILEHEFIKLGFSHVYNFEPAANIAALSAKSVPNTIADFFNVATARKFLAKYGKATLITSNNCFAHIPDLNSIVKGIKNLLTVEGVFIFENAYLLNTVINKDIGQYYAEHIFYHSIQPLDFFFKKHGLRIFDIQLNEVQMGSIRVFVCRESSKRNTSSSVNNLIKLETDFKLSEPETFVRLLREVEMEKSKLVSELKKFKKVVLYGVPAKIVLLINYFGIEKYIRYAVDDSPIKVGKYIPGTKILIKSSREWLEDKAPATMIGAYNFSDDIIAKNKAYNGKWIIPFK